MHDIDLSEGYLVAGVGGSRVRFGLRPQDCLSGRGKRPFSRFWTGGTGVGL